MLKKASDTVVVALVSFLIMLGTQTWSSYLAEKTGSIVLGPFLDSKEGSSFSITIENRTSDPLGAVEILLPAAVDVDSIATTSPVVIERLQAVRAPQGLQSISVSSIQARTRVGLQIPIDEEIRRGFRLRIINIHALDLRLVDFEQIETPWRRIFLSGSAVALLCALLLGGFAYYMHRITSNVSTRFEEAKEDQEKRLARSRDRLDRLQSEVKEITRRNKRFNALHGRILAHYRKELHFWRDTLRSLLKRENGKAAQAVFQEISNVLGTYATHGRAESDFERLESLVEELVESGSLRQVPTGQPATAAGPAPPQSGTAGR